jgi:outer membrane protein OmpA-like peptidoglycan-associated protein
MLLVKKLFWFSLVLSLPQYASAQKDAPIYLNNPSFEDVPRASATPSGWYDCGQMRDSPPDVQPGFWEVSTPAYHGSSYLGMVVRDNETWESVGQRLSRPLEINNCYELSMHVCKAPKYLSKSPMSVDVVDFATPACIMIWGGNGYCDKAELLYKSTIINHSRWLETNCRLSPTAGNYSFILIEAYYKTPVLFPYNGHVLVDNLTPITTVACGPEKMPDPKPKKPTLAAKEVPKKTGPTTTIGPVPSTKVESAPVKKAEEPIGKSTRRNVIYKLEKVYFEADKYELRPESATQLEELVQFLRRRPDVIIEVGGHTNNQMWPNDAFALELSTNRAKAVANYIISRGIPAGQVQYKGYGWTKPIYPNTTADGRQKNQRVEATVISSNG